MLSRYWQIQYILVDSPTLGILTYFETNYAYGNIRYAEIPKVDPSTRMQKIQGRRMGSGRL